MSKEVNRCDENSQWWKDIYRSIYEQGFRDGQADVLNKFHTTITESEDDLK